MSVSANAMDYQRRVQRVIDLVVENPGMPHTVNSLAEVACFSPYHFHRIFRSIAGESLGRYVQRIRVQRGALELRSKPQATVTEVALNVGYESPDGFRRAFQSVFAMSPSQWDRTSPLQERAIAQPGYEFPSFPLDELRQMARDHALNVELADIPKQRLACISIPDAYNNIEAVTAACHRLVDWIEFAGIPSGPGSFYGITWDDPDITPTENCTFEWAVRLPDGFAAALPAWLHVREEAAITVAQVQLHGDLNGEDAIWQYLYRVWLPESEYEPAHAAAREIYQTLPTITGWERLDLKCALPVGRRREW